MQPNKAQALINQKNIQYNEMILTDIQYFRPFKMKMLNIYRLSLDISIFFLMQCIFHTFDIESECNNSNRKQVNYKI